MRAADVCKRLGITKRTLGAWKACGKLTWTRSPAGRKFYREEDVELIAKTDPGRIKHFQRAEARPMKYSYKTSDVARILGVSQDTAQRWIDQYAQQLGLSARSKGKFRSLTKAQIEFVAKSRGITPKFLKPTEILLDTGHAAEFLGVSLWTLRRLRSPWTEKNGGQPYAVEALLPAINPTGTVGKGRSMYTLAQLLAYSQRYPGVVPHAKTIDDGAPKEDSEQPLEVL